MDLHGGPSSSHPSYQLVDNIPLIKSPSLWTPKPVELPQDIHPLPDSIDAYFVYPFTLESHVLSTHPQRLASLDSLQKSRLETLSAREEEKVRRKKEELRKVAPGWDPDGGGMIPVKRDGSGATVGASVPGVAVGVPPEERKAERGVMDDLVDHLEKLDAIRGSPLSPTGAPGGASTAPAATISTTGTTGPNFSPLPPPSSAVSSTFSNLQAAPGLPPPPPPPPASSTDQSFDSFWTPPPPRS